MTPEEPAYPAPRGSYEIPDEIRRYADSEDKDVVVAETDYGLSFASVIAKKDVYGTQFHPEKSGRPGDLALRNFAEIVKR